MNLSAEAAKTGDKLSVTVGPVTVGPVTQYGFHNYSLAMARHFGLKKISTAVSHLPVHVKWSNVHKTSGCEIVGRH